jgi:HEAT repeat protein
MKYFTPHIQLEAAIRDLQHPKPSIRLLAAEALGHPLPHEAPRAQAALRRQLEDESPEVRYRVALSLGSLEDQEAVPLLMKMVQEEAEPLPRQAVISALGEIGDQRATECLLAALQQDSADVRFHAVSALAQIAPRAIAPYLHELLHDADPTIRASAAAVIGDLADRRFAESLADRLEHELGTVRFEIAIALTRMGDSRGHGVLAEFINHKDFGMVAVEYLFRFPKQSAIPVLHQVLTRWGSSALSKVWAAGALARLEEQRGREALLKLLRHHDSMVQGLCIQVLGDIGTSWARETLKKLLDSPPRRRWKKWREEINEILEKKREDP